MTVSTRLVVVSIFCLLLAHLIAIFFGWYSYTWIDVIIHFLVGAISGLVFFLLFDHFVGEHANHHTAEKIKIMIISVSFASLIGVLWETHEFILSEYFSIYIQKSVGEMINDLLIVMLGAIISSIAVVYAKNYKKIPSQK